MRFAAPSLTLALLLVPAVAVAAPPKPAKPVRTARVHPIDKAQPKTCAKPAVEIVAGGETSTLSLARCDGSAAPIAVDQVSILARPPSIARPKITVEAMGRAHGHDVAPGIRRLDPRLVERLELAIDHFRKPGATPKVSIVSGFRPKSSGSYHQTGRALDVRIDGVSNEALVAFCKTLPDTGCGYYPNSLFVHIDVRDAGAGHVAWIDASKPGEAPRYVTAWPPTSEQAPKLPLLPIDDQALTRGARGHRMDRQPYPL